ncbi:hypothetical protein SHKM778_55260 [Streptomyces sp. KM77-8]|uniref:CBM2 domain-containing protein n=1 Tax=Streptomyces haneummycinicus TaxID=3074435 RepID=A0AAT9HNW8_9ACTN
MKRFLAFLATCATVLGLTSLTAPQAVAAAGCRVDYTITSQWQGGFQGGVKVTNLGAPVTGWTLAFALPDAGQRIVQGWNATWSQSGSAVTAADAGWNRVLATGATVDLGFTGTFTGANPRPAAFTLNGVACTGTIEEPRPTRTTTPPSASTDNCASAASTSATSTTVPSSCAA